MQLCIYRPVKSIPEVSILRTIDLITIIVGLCSKHMEFNDKIGSSVFLVLIQFNCHAVVEYVYTIAVSSCRIALSADENFRKGLVFLIPYLIIYIL